MAVDAGERVVAVLLAAGESSRFAAATSKQLARVDEETMVRRTARILLASDVDEVLLVSGRDRAAVETEVADLGVRCVHNPDYAKGLATSLRSGVAALGEGAAAAVFVPCDQPALDSATIGRLVAAWRRGAAIAVPTHAGRRGAPVLFDRRFFAELAAASGDEGGRQLIRRYPEAVAEVELPEGAPLEDFDTVAELERLRAGRTETRP